MRTGAAPGCRSMTSQSARTNVLVSVKRWGSLTTTVRGARAAAALATKGVAPACWSASLHAANGSTGVGGVAGATVSSATLRKSRFQS